MELSVSNNLTSRSDYLPSVTVEETEAQRG